MCKTELSYAFEEELLNDLDSIEQLAHTVQKFNLRICYKKGKIPGNPSPLTPRTVFQKCHSCITPKPLLSGRGPGGWEPGRIRAGSREEAERDAGVMRGRKAGEE